MPYKKYVTLIGHATSDATVTTAKSGGKLVKFCIAIKDRPGPDGQRKTEFWNCVQFSKEYKYDLSAEKIRKGFVVFADGTPSMDQYTGKDGKERASLKCFANTVVVEEWHPKGQTHETISDQVGFESNQQGNYDNEDPFL